MPSSLPVEKWRNFRGREIILVQVGTVIGAAITLSSKVLYMSNEKSKKQKIKYYTR